jgi:transposase InsO family protein
VDNDDAFLSRHLAQITISLGIVLIHSRPDHPQGRAKVVRWFLPVGSALFA